MAWPHIILPIPIDYREHIGIAPELQCVPQTVVKHDVEEGSLFFCLARVRCLPAAVEGEQGMVKGEAVPMEIEVEGGQGQGMVAPKGDQISTSPSPPKDASGHFDDSNGKTGKSSTISVFEMGDILCWF